MLVKVFGGFDIVAGLILIFLNTLNPTRTILLVLGIILLIKSSIGFLKDFASWVDFLAGIVFLMSIIINIPIFIGIILGILLIQKGVFSFL